MGWALGWATGWVTMLVMTVLPGNPVGMIVLSR
jgi:hypothetical protein